MDVLIFHNDRSNNFAFLELPSVGGEKHSEAMCQSPAMSLSSGTFPRACPPAEVGHPELAHFHLYLNPQVGAGGFLPSTDTGGWAY